MTLAPVRALPARVAETCRGVRRPAWLGDELLQGVRWGLVGLWGLVFARQVILGGIPWLRSDLLLWLMALLMALSIGRRSVLAVLLDFLPFAAVLVAYDYLRGLADTMGMPTWWQPQVSVERFFFAGHIPTVWLQEHLKHATAQWWDVAVSLCYISFFFLPYVTAAVMWLRRRADFYRWSLRFVALSFLGFVAFALAPAAPPWAAAKCSASAVANHPANPYCLTFGNPRPGGLLGPFTTHVPHAQPYVQRISVRGLTDLHLRFADAVITAGQDSVDNVAAVPSLHLGGTVLFVLLVWPRVRKAWRPLLVAYPLFMTFSLAYSGEHYVVDCLTGALLAVLVHLGAGRIERRRSGRAERRTERRKAGSPAPDTLEVPH